MFGLLGRELAGGRRKPAAPPSPPKARDNGQPKPPAKPPSDDDLYSAGDICAPEPDRDDEQRDL